jgi:hypothetical protein
MPIQGFITLCTRRGCYRPPMKNPLQETGHTPAPGILARPPRIGRRCVSSSLMRCCGNSPSYRHKWAEFETFGRITWATDLAEIPEKFEDTNVHAELGTS